MNKQISLANTVNTLLDRIQALSLDHNKPTEEHPALVRTLFRPLLIYLVSQGEQFPPENLTPEGVINAVLARQELTLDPKLVEECGNKYASSPDKPAINWQEEVLQISLTGSKHPLDKLVQAVKVQLTPQAKTELTRLEFTPG